MAEVFYNEDPHHCMHSVAIVGDVEPGQSRTVRGKIVLIAAGPEAAFELLQFGA